MAKFEVGHQVVDLDGFRGTIVKVTEWEGRVWYDVKLPGGVGVRFDSDLKLDESEVAR
jgi:hypothetical protein